MHRPRVVEQPELKQKDLNLMGLEKDFSKEQFHLAPWPEGTVVFYQAHRTLYDCQWRYVDEDNCKIGGENLFVPGESTSWYMNARCRFYVVFTNTHYGIEAQLSPCSAPQSRCPGVSILPTITPLELLILYTH